MTTFPEYARAVPEEASKALKAWKYLLNACIVFVVPLLFAVAHFKQTGPILYIGPLLIGPFLLRYIKAKLAMEHAFSLISEREKIDSSKMLSSVNEEVKAMGNSLSNIKATGHVVMAGGGATVIIDSTVVNSFNQIQSDDPELADSIAKISGFVEQSGNKEAGKIWTRFIKEMTAEKDPVVMKSLWEKLVSLIPDVTSVIVNIAKITQLFL